MKSFVRTAILLITAAAVYCEAAPAPQSPSVRVFIRANVYLFHWSVISNRVRSMDETRTTHSESLEITDPSVVRDFVGWLDLGALKPNEDAIQHQALLVVDLTGADGSKTTFYSDGCRLYSADSKSSRPIDQTFRKQFDFYGDDMIISSGGKTYNLCSGEIK